MSYHTGYPVPQMNTEQAIHRLRAVIRRQHKALSTESSYVSWLRRYMSALHRYPASLTREQKVERFLTDLARHRDISASSQNQAFNALLFFYREVLKVELGRSMHFAPSSLPPSLSVPHLKK